MDMDFTFWIAILVMYLLQYVLGKKKKQQPVQKPQLDSSRATSQNPYPSEDFQSSDLEEDPHGSSGSSEFHDALSEISRMLSGADHKKAETRSAPETQPPVKVRTTLASIPNSKAKRNRPLAAEDSFFDEEFERKEYVAFHKPEIHHPIQGIPGPKKVIPVSKRMTISQEVNRDIRDRAKAQEALVLAEVLGPPVSKRPHRRR